MSSYLLSYILFFLDLTKACTFDIYDYSKTVFAVCFNNIGVSSLKMAIAPKHVKKEQINGKVHNI